MARPKGSKKGHTGSAAVTILNILMNADRHLTTNQLCYRADCDRKTVYNAIAILETNGFAIDVDFADRQNRYKYIGLRGL